MRLFATPAGLLDLTRTVTPVGTGWISRVNTPYFFPQGLRVLVAVPCLLLGDDAGGRTTCDRFINTLSGRRKPAAVQ